MYVSGYAISEILSQLTSDDLGQWHLAAFIKIRYKIDDAELLVIVKVFETWRYYLKSCMYEVFILTDHKNLQYFIDTKSLCSR